MYVQRIGGVESPNFDFYVVNFDTMKLIFCVKTAEPLIPQWFWGIEKERKLQYKWYHNFRSYLVRMTGLDRIIVLPPSGRRQATVHQTVAFRWVRALSFLRLIKRGGWSLLFFIGADDRTRTCTLARWNLNPMSLPIPPHPRIPLFLPGEEPGVGRFAWSTFYKNRRTCFYLFSGVTLQQEPRHPLRVPVYHGRGRMSTSLRGHFGFLNENMGKDRANLCI